MNKRKGQKGIILRQTDAYWKTLNKVFLLLHAPRKKVNASPPAMCQYETLHVYSDSLQEKKKIGRRGGEERLQVIINVPNIVLAPRHRVSSRRSADINPRQMLHQPVQMCVPLDPFWFRSLVLDQLYHL